MLSFSLTLFEFISYQQFWFISMHLVSTSIHLGIGHVVSLGTDCKRSKIGQSVGYMQFGAFSEYIVVTETAVIPLPSAKAQYLPLLVSGLTAAISLDKVGIVLHEATIISDR